MTKLTQKGRSLIVSIDGDIDHHSAESIKAQIDAEYERANAKDLVFDFEKVTFMDSSGIGMIIGRYKKAQEKGGHVAAAAIGKNVERIFTLSGLHKIIKTYGAVDDALGEAVR